MLEAQGGGLIRLSSELSAVLLSNSECDRHAFRSPPTTGLRAVRTSGTSSRGFPGRGLYVTFHFLE
ncbi:MAG TPA: hypothetical protein VMK12_20820 [Anaeromyxobacteraceae bacterium]|nr:hypothetical protein [Anaeromyxobacteraceae bacterium]